MTPFLQLQEVTKIFGTSRGPYVAVNDVSLDIQRGEIVSLIGHSGCGKSTVLNMIAGLERATAGTVCLEGRLITEPGPDRALVFQNYSLLPWMSVWDNIFEAVDSVVTGLSKAEKRERVEHFLQMVGLWQHRFKRPGQISGGMKQRVAVARAFAVHPSVLLLDEPFGSLDALTRASLQEELVKIWSLDNNTETVVMVTHDIEEAILLSDRIAVMTNGPYATIGEVVQVPLDRPRHEREIVANPVYREIHDHLWYLLTEAYAEAA
ncbi:MAG: nitrate/nitrite transport system ATP-binding protein [Chloroflexota bacterium]|nr:nitrate/nitrite transport system ATP-binding protein [Chloroflexota bacterium]